MTRRDDLAARLVAAGFDLPAAYRALAVLAGERIPPSAQIQAAGRRHIAQQLRARMPRADATRAVVERFGVSIRQAWRDTAGEL